MSDAFKKLLGELSAAQADIDSLAKALPTGDDAKDDKKIQAAAGEGDGDGDGDDKDKDGEGGEGSAMGKSFTIKLEDGTEVEATDGAELIKSLQARIETGEETFAKALGQSLELIKAQGQMIKSLGEQVAKLAGEGRGRKAVVSITEKVPAGESRLAKGGQGAGDGPTVEEFLAKSEVAWKAGKISGREYTTIDVACRAGTAVDNDLIKKVLA